MIYVFMFIYTVVAIFTILIFKEKEGPLFFPGWFPYLMAFAWPLSLIFFPFTILWIILEIRKVK
jgi:hypothetical protein